ncbi:hypothetical protein J2W22_002146 [Sphingomonas kyeonggiensis]|uniref:hypothetical protein n=1 Tax=Sphingomonas kyeonggiensis TaxID=1268553 RepID=UPI0027807A09|nr:hypothetical protein [Sphingomonas kyeonggiensis]MDQ0250082.1 hypothetical protein [Sphingomonas kyeonggiensis]
MFHSPYPGDIAVIGIGLVCAALTLRAGFRLVFVELPVSERKKEFTGVLLFAGWVGIMTCLFLYHHHQMGISGA